MSQLFLTRSVLFILVLPCLLWVSDRRSRVFISIWICRFILTCGKCLNLIYRFIITSAAGPCTDTTENRNSMQQIIMDVKIFKNTLRKVMSITKKWIININMDIKSCNVALPVSLWSVSWPEVMRFDLLDDSVKSSLSSECPSSIASVVCHRYYNEIVDKWYSDQYSLSV